ncbi:MAG: hypothetical protein NTV32_05370, partial [Gammaproteobacteria bacterium]|nr:hypothetical protein [Gammaproteobacteria bacterium]
PTYHLEAITSRPLLLHAVAKQTSHSGQTRVTITSTHGKRETVERLLGVCRSCRVSDKKIRFFSKSRALNFKNFALKSA